jgi:hypothetical protein
MDCDISDERTLYLASMDLMPVIHYMVRGDLRIAIYRATAWPLMLIEYHMNVLRQSCMGTNSLFRTNSAS